MNSQLTLKGNYCGTARHGNQWTTKARSTTRCEARHDAQRMRRLQAASSIDSVTMDGHQAASNNCWYGSRDSRGTARAARARTHAQEPYEGATTGFCPHVVSAPSVSRRRGRQGWLWSSSGAREMWTTAPRRSTAGEVIAMFVFVLVPK